MSRDEYNKETKSPQVGEVLLFLTIMVMIMPMMNWLIHLVKYSDSVKNAKAYVESRSYKVNTVECYPLFLNGFDCAVTVYDSGDALDTILVHARINDCGIEPK